MQPRSTAASTPHAPAPGAAKHPLRIVLTGFMGSGKTTVGRLLAAHLQWDFIDLDAAVERLCGLPVPRVFAEQGEAEFRRLETRALAEALGGSRLVLALGGGVPEAPENRALLSSSPTTAVVYLAAPLETLLARCALQAQEPSATARPVLADPAEAERRFRRRIALYESLSTHVVQTASRSPRDTLGAVIRVLGWPPLPAADAPQ